MERRNIVIIMRAGGFVFFFIFLMISIFAPNDDPWRSYFFTWQTLIGGTLAIGAAYMTVMQMRDSDAKSDWRHEQLVRLQMRPDKLRLDRALVPQFSRLEACRMHLQSLLGNDQVELSFDDALNRFRQKLAPVQDATRQMHGVLTGEKWNDVRGLFGGALTHELEGLEHSLRVLEHACVTISHYSPPKEEKMKTLFATRPELSDDAKRAGILKFPGQIATVVDAAGRLSKEVRSLADLYEIKL